MIYTVEIILKKGFPDKHGEHVRRDIAGLGVKRVPAVRYYPVYTLEGDLSADDVDRIASGLLIDPLTETYSAAAADAAGRASSRPRRGGRHEIEVWLKPGVTDTVAESVTKAVRDMGITRPLKVKTGHKFVFGGEISPQAVRQIAERLLVNALIQEYSIR